MKYIGAFFLGLPHRFSPAQRESAGQILVRLSKLSPEQHQTTLVEKSQKRRGEFLQHAASSADRTVLTGLPQTLSVRPVPTRVSGNRQLVRIQSEFNSGAHRVDVANGSPELAVGFRKLGIIDPYQSPQRDFYVAPSKDKDGLRHVVEEGQSTVTAFGRVSARKGVNQRFPELMAKEIFHADVAIMEQINQEFGQIFWGR